MADLGPLFARSSPILEPPPTANVRPPLHPLENAALLASMARLDALLAAGTRREEAKVREREAQENRAASFSANWPVSACRLRIMDAVRDVPRSWPALTKELWSLEPAELAQTSAETARKELLNEGFLLAFEAGLCLNPEHPGYPWRGSQRIPDTMSPSSASLPSASLPSASPPSASRPSASPPSASLPAAPPPSAPLPSAPPPLAPPAAAGPPLVPA